MLQHAQQAEKVRTGWWRRRLRLLLALAFVALFVALALLAPLLFAHGYNQQNLMSSLMPPSSGNPLGTDEFGRNELARIVWGAQVSLEVGFIAVLAGAAFGGLLGIVAGLFGGVVDTLISAVADVIWSFPIILLAIGLVAILRPGVESAIVAIAFGFWPQYARVVRSSTLELRGRNFVEAAVAVGASQWRIALRHILPNVLGQIVVLASVGVADAILAEATLSFLGLGAQPPLPDWGGMLSAAQTYVLQAPWLSLAPGVAITLVVIAFNELGEALADVFAPQRRSLAG